MDIYDENAMLGQLEVLSRSSKTAFAAACAERLWPLIERYAEAIAMPEGQIERLRGALDQIWVVASGGVLDLRATQVLAESMIPSEGEGPWVFEVGYGQNGIAAIAYAARTWLTNQPQEAVWAARQVYEAGDYAADHGAMGLTASAATSHDAPIMRAIVSGLNSDLALAARTSPPDVRDQARIAARLFAGLFPD